MALAPVQFGKYLLLERLAVGGMAEVYLAKSEGTATGDHLVAVKRILPTIAEDKEFVAMFIDEAKIAGSLNHRNIALIYDLGKIHSSYFLAMEYVAGVDLRSVWNYARNNGPLPIDMVCHTIVKICEGLDYAHRRRDAEGQALSIIHRDISPQNVLLSFDGDVKIIDFGIAKAAGRTVKTQAGVLKGKYAYMAPEQARGAKIDHRVDVFAVGVILYELATGERLYRANSDFQLLEKVRHATFTPPSELRPELAGELERIILKSLAADVDERYNWASSLQLDLERYIVSHDLAFSRDFMAQYVKHTFDDDYEIEQERRVKYEAISFPSQNHPSETQTGTTDPQFEPNDEDFLTRDEHHAAGAIHDVTQIQTSPFEQENDALINDSTLVSDDTDLIAQVRQSLSSNSVNLNSNFAKNDTQSEDLQTNDLAEDHDSYTSWDGEQDDVHDEEPGFAESQPLDDEEDDYEPSLQKDEYADDNDFAQYEEEDSNGGFSLDPRDIATQHVDVRHRATNDSEQEFSTTGPQTRRKMLLSFLAGLVTTSILVSLVLLVSEKEPGFLVVITHPDLAMIQIPEQKLQTSSPAQFRLKQGQYQLKITGPGAEPLIKSVEIQSGQLTLIDEKLPRGTGDIEITTVPSGAQVLLDGEMQGKTPLSIHKVLSEQDHVLKLHHKLTKDFEQHFQVLGGEQKKLTFNLPYSYSRVQLKPIPDDAILYWEGRWRRKLSIPKLRLGKTVSYKLRRPGCKPYSDKIKPKGEPKITIAPSLDCGDITNGGTLTVTGSRRGRVLIDDVDLGRLPLLNYKLPAGQYKIIVRGRRKTFQQNIDIGSGERKKIRVKIR